MNYLPDVYAFVIPPADTSASSNQQSDYKPPMTQQSRVSFAEGTAFDRERTCKYIADIIQG